MALKANKEENLAIEIGKELNIGVIEALTQQFMDACKKSPSVILTGTNIENIDLTGIQFLYFAENFAKKNKIELKKSISYTESVRELISKTGFENK